jgi:hypothetical protein
MGWKIDETRRHIERIYGRKQLELANPSLHSAVERQAFARIHYSDTKRVLADYVESHLKSSSLIEVVFLGDEQAQDAFQEFICKAGAYVTACVQSLHAVNDILSHAIYFSLGMNLQSSPLLEHKIDATAVIDRLKKAPELASLYTMFSELCNGKGSEHLRALSNHGKHRSVIRASLSEDQTKLSGDNHSIKLPRFQYRGSDHPEVAVGTFLETQYSRSSRYLVDIGIELNRILATR